MTVKGVPKDEQAYLMRVSGYRVDQIAETLGLSITEANDLILQVGERKAAVSAETLRISTQLEIDRIDALLKALWPAAEAGDLATVDRVQRLMERRAKMLGLDAPEIRAQLQIQAHDRIDLSKLSTDEIRTLLALQAKMSGDPEAPERVRIKDVARRKRLATEPVTIDAEGEDPG